MEGESDKKGCNFGWNSAHSLISWGIYIYVGGKRTGLLCLSAGYRHWLLAILKGLQTSRHFWLSVGAAIWGTNGHWLQHSTYHLGVRTVVEGISLHMAPRISPADILRGLQWPRETRYQHTMLLDSPKPIWIVLWFPHLLMFNPEFGQR